MHPRASELINLLSLEPHPEGGYFSQVFRSSAKVQPEDGRDKRPALTTIYFLLIEGMHSRWHRVESDEVWHYYEGDILELYWIDPTDLKYHCCLLGPIGKAKTYVQVVPAGCWQAARTKGAYTLVGCTVAPGFEYKDFTLLCNHPEVAAQILSRFPELKIFI